MNNFSEIAIRYSKAIYELAFEKDILSKIEKDFILLESVSNNTDIQKLIKTSLISIKDQSSCFKSILKKIKADTITLNFILVLIENRRIAFLDEIINSFFNQLKKEKGNLIVDIFTTTKLEKDSENRLSKSIKEITKNKKIIINKIIDKSIIGGLIIKYDSVMIDKSIKTQLNQLKLKMKEV